MGVAHCRIGGRDPRDEAVCGLRYGDTNAVFGIHLHFPIKMFVGAEAGHQL